VLQRDEFEYGVTFVPAALVVLGIALNARRMATAQFWAGWSRAHWIYAGLGSLLLAAPVALNYYHPSWNAVLKQTPVLANSVTLFRWVSVWIPTSILLGILAAERTPVLRALRIPIAVAGMAIVVGLNATADRSFYERQPYDPRAIAEAYWRVKSGEWTPAITRIGVQYDGPGWQTFAWSRNDLLARGASPLSCAESLFGYELEMFPRKTLRPGPALESKDGVLNLKNPACYVFPEQNRCSPGDHFSSAQRREARAFTRYEPIPFAASRWQRLANAVSPLALALIGTIVIAYAVRGALLFRSSRRSPSRPR
jgi:hypothetical protein